MNYEKIIIELMSRIQTLEEQVEYLMAKEKDVIEDETKIKKIGTKELREYIELLKENAKTRSEDHIVLRSGDIHKELGLKSMMPSVCNAMRQCMTDGDVILHQTPSGNSSTLEIKYYLSNLQIRGQTLLE